MILSLEIVGKSTDIPLQCGDKEHSCHRNCLWSCRKTYSPSVYLLKMCQYSHSLLATLYANIPIRLYRYTEDGTSAQTSFRVNFIQRFTCICI